MTTRRAFVSSTVTRELYEMTPDLPIIEPEMVLGPFTIKPGGIQVIHGEIRSLGVNNVIRLMDACRKVA